MRHFARPVLVAFALALPSAIAAQAHRQDGDAPPAAEKAAATHLSKATQNPVGDLLIVPFQFNYFSGGALGVVSLLYPAR